MQIIIRNWGCFGIYILGRAAEIFLDWNEVGKDYTAFIFTDVRQHAPHNSGQCKKNQQSCQVCLQSCTTVQHLTL